MKTLRTMTLGCFVAAMMALGAGTAQAQTTSNGPYYAWPAWDQKLDCTATTNCPRFIVLSNMNSEAVLDRETGLVWQKSPAPTAVTWQNGQTLCNHHIAGNRIGWRLPTVQELASLVDNPNIAFVGHLPPGHPFSNVQSSSYWSATSIAADTSKAWVVRFDIGNVDDALKGQSLFFWCVRGGQGVDPQ